jgi:hypothetical protein
MQEMMDGERGETVTSGNGESPTKPTASASGEIYADQALIYYIAEVRCSQVVKRVGLPSGPPSLLSAV